eukprot:gene1759-528_t
MFQITKFILNSINPSDLYESINFEINFEKEEEKIEEINFKIFFVADYAFKKQKTELINETKSFTNKNNRIIFDIPKETLETKIQNEIPSYLLYNIAALEIQINEKFNYPIVTQISEKLEKTILQPF